MASKLCLRPEEMAFCQRRQARFVHRYDVIIILFAESYELEWQGSDSR